MGCRPPSALSPDLIETFAKSGLYAFGIGWALALVMEGIDRITWRLDPRLKPADLLAKRKRTPRTKSKREIEEPGPNMTPEAALPVKQKTESVARLPD